MSIQHRLHARCGCLASGSAAAKHPFAFSTSPRNFERDRPFLVDHLALDLSLDLARKSVSGTATLKVRRADPFSTAIELDAIAFAVQRVEVDGTRASYTYDGQRLRIELGERQSATLTVAYQATPRRGLYFLEPDAHYPERPRQVWSQCQEEDARHFFPCHDKPHIKMSTELTVRVPLGWFALSNGALIERRRDGEEELFHWKMAEPHPSYLMTLVAGEFTELVDDADGIPVTYLVSKGREVDGRRTFARTPDMIRYFGALLGVRYPWNKYAQIVVSDFFFGGMENTTATTMYEHILLDARASLDVTSDDLISHELAHQWFGDYVTCRDWSEGWLNEGFATFFEHLWREHALGDDEYEYGLKGDLASYLGEAAGQYRRSLVCQDYDAPLDLFDRHLYEKGGLTLHVLRRLLGHELFFRGLRAYLEAHAMGIVETRDLQRALEGASGRSLGRCFEELVHRPGHPELDVQIAWDDGVLTITLKQVQSTAYGVPEVFHFPLVVDLAREGEAPERRSFEVTQRSQVFAVAAARRPTFVVIDPDLRVLGDVRVRAPNDMLHAQLSGAPTARGRWLAVAALGRANDQLTRDALGARLADEREFWGVRAECAEALGATRATEAFTLLEAALATPHPKVRRAIAAALGHFRTPRAAELLGPRARSDLSYLVEAEAARALGRTRQGTAFDVLVDLLDRPSWAEVIRVGAIDGLAALRDERAFPHLAARTRYGHPGRARRASILALPKIVDGRAVRELLVDLLDDFDPLLRQDVARALLELGDIKSRGPLRAREEIDLDSRVRRRLREVLRELSGPPRALAAELEGEIEKLRSQNSELEGRLVRIEARLTARASKKLVKPHAKKGATKGQRPARRGQ